VASTINGKAGVDESLSSYLGMYWGSLINPQVQEVVEGADLLLWVGPR
jgi:TPP-dependent 2-oxoacid decarboxylase